MDEAEALSVAIVSVERLSFDTVQKPPAPGMRLLTRANYQRDPGFAARNYQPSRVRFTAPAQAGEIFGPDRGAPDEKEPAPELQPARGPSRCGFRAGGNGRSRPATTFEAVRSTPHHAPSLPHWYRAKACYSLPLVRAPLLVSDDLEKIHPKMSRHESNVDGPRSGDKSRPFRVVFEPLPGS